MKRFVASTWRYAVLILIVAIGVGVLTEHQAIQDWFKLRNYTPSAAVVSLANQDTMTPKARHLFYVNHPQISTGETFTSHCPVGGEKTVVLGCYISNDQGIYLYDVTDPRLSGVEQVTAAHETLHAAYRRLSASERAKVDAMLLDFYDHDLTDQRIKDTIAAYRKSEPNEVVNEMHSVFGTECPNLPAPLEQYYKQYFTNRTVVTDFTAQYQGEFTSRQSQITTYDNQLATLKQRIDADEAALSTQKSQLDQQAATLNSERSANQIDAYNNGVASYNVQVKNYNDLLTATKNAINQYNSIVTARNTIALEEQELTQALSADTLPSTQ